MKKIIILIFVISLILILSACNNNKISELEPAKKMKEEAFGFKIEKLVLSKGYQTLEPKVEVLTENNETKLNINFGLIECSGITIDNITKIGDQINIYTNRLLENDKTQLAIPQATIALDTNLDEKVDNIKFNIVNQNYTPINLKFEKSQVLNNIYAQFKISPNSIPNVNLIRHKDSFIWDVVFKGIFDTENYKTPLVNLNVKTDALTGEIVDSYKNTISDYIDDGIILDYEPKTYLLYKQKNVVDEENIETLWIYDLEKKEKDKIYETNDSIYLANFSPDNNSISLIENDNGVTDIYLINIDDKVANKISSDGYNHTWNMKWADLNNICFLNNDKNERSTLFLYNKKNNNIKEIFTISKNISNFDIVNELIVFTEYDEKNHNQNIFVTMDGSKLDKINTGHSVSFFNNDTIVFLKHIPEKNENKLYLYNVNNKSIKIPTNINIVNYFKLNSEVLLIIEKGNCENEYILSSCNILNGKINEISKINSEKIYYNEDLNKGYITLSSPLEDSKKHIIYSINLNKM